MVLKLFRYNKECYIFDGRVDSVTLNMLSMFGVVEKESIKELNNCDIVMPLFCISKSMVQKINNFINKTKLNIKIICVEDIKNYIYYGEKDEKSILESITYFIDDKGNYIYIIDRDNVNNTDLNLLMDHPFYLLSFAELNNIPKIENTLYLEDYMFNTKLSVNDKYNSYIYYNNCDNLDLYRVINRIILS